MRNVIASHHSAQPQFNTGSRLLQLGEAIEFHLYLPGKIPPENITIFPCYLEQADPGDAFDPDGGLGWLECMPAETLGLTFRDGCCSITYTPGNVGSYLARWSVGEIIFYRYFSVVEEDSIVLRFSTFLALESNPTLHGTGIPLDYRLPAAQFDLDDELFQKFLSYHRYYGDNLIPVLPDIPPSFTVTQRQRIDLYSLLLEQARFALPFPDDLRSVRIEMMHAVDPGYTEVLTQLGVADHCGLHEANAKPWLGMPEFPYYSSLTDCRKIFPD